MQLHNCMNHNDSHSGVAVHSSTANLKCNIMWTKATGYLQLATGMCKVAWMIMCPGELYNDIDSTADARTASNAMHNTHIW